MHPFHAVEKKKLYLEVHGVVIMWSYKLYCHL